MSQAAQIRPLIRKGFPAFLSNFMSGLTLDVLAFTFAMAAAASRFRSAV
jgi:hypothetical protein